MGLVILCALMPAACSTALSQDPFPGRGSDGSTRVGARAPQFGIERWLNTETLEIGDLLGEVVLVRWWTDTCPFCSTSAPAIVSIAEEFAEDGLKVVGIYHPKPPTSVDRSIERAKNTARRFDFDFPIGIDADWSALRRWWLNHEKGWTSVTFVVDRTGTIRWVHPGGEYHPAGPLDALEHWDDHSSCHREYDQLRSVLRKLFAEPAA